MAVQVEVAEKGAAAVSQVGRWQTCKLHGLRQVGVVAFAQVVPQKGRAVVAGGGPIRYLLWQEIQHHVGWEAEVHGRGHCHNRQSVGRCRRTGCAKGAALDRRQVRQVGGTGDHTDILSYDADSHTSRFP